MYSNHLVKLYTTTYTEGVIVIDNHWHGTSVSLYILFSKFSTYSPNYTRIHVEIFWTWLRVNWMVLIFCLRIKMPRLSEGLILHVRQQEIVWKYIIWTYSGTEEAELWQSRQSRSAFTSLGMKVDLKCETTDLLQSRQKGSEEAELPIFGNEGRVLVEKPIFRSLAVKIERKCRSETANLWKSRQRWNAEAERHIFWSPGRTSAESGTSDLCQSRQSGSAGAELHIFGSQGRAEVRKRNFTFLAVNAERKCGRGTSDLWQSRQSGNAEAEHQVFGS